MILVCSFCSPPFCWKCLSVLFSGKVLKGSFFGIMMCTWQCFDFFLPYLYHFYLQLMSYLSRTSSTVLSKRGDGRHVCLVPDGSSNALSFSSFIMLATDLSYIALLCQDNFFLSISEFLQDFLTCKDLGFFFF